MARPHMYVLLLTEIVSVWAVDSRDFGQSRLSGLSLGAFVNSAKTSDCVYQGSYRHRSIPEPV